MLPVVNIKKHHQDRLIAGSPWIFSNEIDNFSSLKNLASGSLVQINIGDSSLAIGYFNPKTLISCRILTYNCKQQINSAFFIDKINNALQVRNRFFSNNYYRLIHSEADGLPGLIIDRFANVFVCQISTAGMQNLQPILLQALENIFVDAKIIFKNNSEARALEGLEINHTSEEMPPINLQENGINFNVDVSKSQKTGWFFDQAPSRTFAASLAKNARVLDAYCFVGGFGINALAQGAKEVVFIDSSRPALDLTKTNCQNLLGDNYQNKCTFYHGQVFDVLQQPSLDTFDIILLDPPPFIQSKKHLFAGLRGYEKLVKMSLPLLKPNGILMLASCSHHANTDQLITAVSNAINKSKKTGRLIAKLGAGSDHPIHPALPESEYLKSLFFVIN